MVLVKIIPFTVLNLNIVLMSLSILAIGPLSAFVCDGFGVSPVSVNSIKDFVSQH